MKRLGRISLMFAVVTGLMVAVAYVDGAMLPVDHTATVAGVVDAPPDEVFALITNVEEGPSWRKSVDGVLLLPEENGHERWIEESGDGQKMSFTAVRTDPVDVNGVARRDVMLNGVDASFGGTWTYQLAEGESPNQTRLSISEAGFIHPPIYRFMMRHVFGMTSSLDQYMDDLKTATGKR